MAISACWPKQGPHRPNKLGRDGVPHQKADPQVVHRFTALLNVPSDHSEVEQLHYDDSRNKWFGLVRNRTGGLNFEEYGRYAALMMSPPSPVRQYPHLVAFVGATNTGKSTMINLLIRGLGSSDVVQYPAPVIGSVRHDTTPTSGDVHLYADPLTFEDQQPILFADCEGFEGGERIPLGSVPRRRGRSSVESPRYVAETNVRTVHWADTEERRQREFGVAAMYPRVLYTFADCVIFVLQNAKTFQSSALVKLLKWGEIALEASINQPVLPHCIVALNHCDPNAGLDGFDVNRATEDLLASVEGMLGYTEGIPWVRNLVDRWNARGQRIRTPKDLIQMYYRTFRVIRIPSRTHITLLHTQTLKLYAHIKDCCSTSFQSREKARMQIDAHELDRYLESGFDHFAASLDTPFDFLRVSLANTPVPADFGSHVFHFMMALEPTQIAAPTTNPSSALHQIGTVLASYLLLDYICFRKGTIADAFAYYQSFLRLAMDRYLQELSPCSYRSADGFRRCNLVQTCHRSKGHQDLFGIFATGPFQSAFDDEFSERWQVGIHQNLAYLHERFVAQHPRRYWEPRMVREMHLHSMDQFFMGMGPASTIQSNATCLCCLMRLPEHPLPCGHTLCTPCIIAYGKQERTSIVLDCCPMHRTSTRWRVAAKISIVPASAGVRVLALDGCGVRGVAQVEMLTALTRKLGDALPIRACFDLVIATGWGAITAMLLSSPRLSADQYVNIFIHLARYAYSQTSRLSILHSHRFNVTMLHRGLRAIMSDNEVLFGYEGVRAAIPRIGVTCTSSTNSGGPTLLANYRRPELDGASYILEQAPHPHAELRVWQAAAAAIASASCGRPYRVRSRVYREDGTLPACPVAVAAREVKAIWPDRTRPDLFLSLGSGYDEQSVVRTLATALPSAGPSASPKVNLWNRWASRRPDDVRSELEWMKLIATVQRGPCPGDVQRYMRINPDLKQSPSASDDLAGMLTLRETIQSGLESGESEERLNEVAWRTISSCFYADVAINLTHRGSDHYALEAQVFCRFEDRTTEVEGVGKYLKRHSQNGSTLDLVLWSESPPLVATTFRLTSEMIQGMIDRRIFQPQSIHSPSCGGEQLWQINLRFSEQNGENVIEYPISGFPRYVSATTLKVSRKARRSENTTLPSRHNKIRNEHGPLAEVAGSIPAFCAELEEHVHDHPFPPSEPVHLHELPADAIDDLI